MLILGILISSLIGGYILSQIAICCYKTIRYIINRN